MDWDAALKICTTMLVSLSGGAGIIFFFSSFLGKVWANRIMEDEKFKHNQALEVLRDELHKKSNKGLADDKEQHEKVLEELRDNLRRDTEKDIKELQYKLDIYKELLLKVHNDKIEIYKIVIDIIGGFLADFGDPKKGAPNPEEFKKKFLEFNKKRMKAYGYLALQAPQKVMNAFDNLVDHLIDISNNVKTFDWPNIRTLVIAMLNEAREDIGINKTSIEYKGKN